MKFKISAETPCIKGMQHLFYFNNCQRRDYIIFTYNYQVSVRMSAGIACRTASVYSETDLHNLGGMHLSESLTHISIKNTL